jgi:hypothetical protein
MDLCYPFLDSRKSVTSVRRLDSEGPLPKGRGADLQPPFRSEENESFGKSEADVQCLPLLEVDNLICGPPIFASTPRSDCASSSSTLVIRRRFRLRGAIRRFRRSGLPHHEAAPKPGEFSCVRISRGRSGSGSLTLFEECEPVAVGSGIRQSATRADGEGSPRVASQRPER